MAVEPHPGAAVDDQQNPQEDVSISLYYGTDSEGNPAGSIAPHPEFGLSQDRGMWEPRIKVRGCGERKVSFHVRPRYAEMEHVDTRDRITSPFDHDHQPDRGYNVRMQGSNLEPDEYLHVLREACRALAEDVGETWGEDRFPEPLDTSNIDQYERYLRLSRKLAEKLTREGGAFHQLAMLLSDEAGSKGAYFWDNGETHSYMSRFLHDETAANAMIPGHSYGSQLKVYHPESPRSDPTDPLYYPKFGALMTRTMSNVKLNDGMVPWSQREDLSRELEERVVNVLAWSGVPIDPNDLGADAEEEYGAYVPDWHFRGEETDLEPELADDPTPEIERSQESMIARSLQRMSDSDVGLTDQLIADGGHAKYDQLAQEAEVSESTVYRWLQRMGNAVESDNGVITFHSSQLREQFQEIIGRTVTSVQNAVDQAVKAADDGEVLQLGSTLSLPGKSNTVVDVGDVVLDGLEAWREEGNSSGTFAEVVEWTDSQGQFHSRLRDRLVREVKESDTDDGVQMLARTFRDLDVVEAVAQVKRMISAGTSWSPEEIQAAVEEAGFDIDVEDAARPDFEIPETPR